MIRKARRESLLLAYNKVYPEHVQSETEVKSYLKKGGGRSKPFDSGSGQFNLPLA